MAEYKILPASLEHFQELAHTMREADVAEVWAGWHKSPLEAIETSVTFSPEAFTGLADGRVVCMFGVAKPFLIGGENIGAPWLLGAEELPDHARAFLRLNKRYIEAVRQDFSRLENYVAADNETAIRWLGWLGFTLEDPKPHGVDQELFCRFTMEGET